MNERPEKIPDGQVISDEDDFLALVSHELRTPLTAILGYSQLLADSERGIDDDMRVLLGKRIRERAEAMRDLVEWLLRSRKLGSEVDLEKTAVLPADLLAGVVRRLPESGRERIDLRVPDGCDAVTCDPRWLGIALDNLVSNALKFSPRTQRVTLALEQADGVTTFVVSDRGPGIPQDAVEGVFARFAQASAAPGQPANGVGFGLYVARRIVDAHGGEISVSSEIGAGSEFRIVLPER